MRKNSLFAFSILFFCLISFFLSSCTKKNLPDAESSTGSVSGEELTAAPDAAELDIKWSPRRFDNTLPADGVDAVFSADTSNYSETKDAKGNIMLISPDKSHSLTYLKNGAGELYAKRFFDVQNSMAFYYGTDEKLYAMGVEDYTGDTLYYVDSGMNLTGIYATTYSVDAVTVHSVYDGNGKRRAAIYEDKNDPNAAAYYNSELKKIDRATYLDIIKEYIDLRG